MFLIFTKENCLSSIKAVNFLKEEGQIYKEVNCNHGVIDKNHLTLLSKASKNNLSKYIREKSDYMIKNSLQLSNLSSNEIEKIILTNFKDVGSFPVIVNLSYDGSAKNCMIGFSEKILKKWIEDENIKDSFVDINKVFGSDECCYLDKKEKMINSFRRINSDDTDIRVSLNSLYELKRKNNSNMGIEEKEYDELKLLRDDTEKLHQKYEDAINEINSNDKFTNFMENNNSQNPINEILEEEKNNETKLENFDENTLNEEDYLDNNIGTDNNLDDVTVMNASSLNDKKNPDETIELIEVIDEKEDNNIVMNDSSEFISPIEEEKEVDYSFDKNESKYDEYVSIDNNIANNSSIFEKEIINDDFVEPNSSENVFESSSNHNNENVEINILDDNNKDEFITIDLASGEELSETKIIDKLTNTNFTKNDNMDDPTNINWLEKYELNDKEIEHQKEVDSEK